MIRKYNRRLLEVFTTKLVFDLKSEASRFYLSYFWWILEPALYVALFYVIFGVLLLRGTEDFLVFLLCGKIPFLWFSKSVTSASGAIMEGRGLINQVAIPKQFFPLLVVSQDLVKQVFVFALLFVFLLLYGSEPHVSWLFVIPIAITQLVLITAASLVAASITPFLPDFRYIVSTTMMMLMFSSGIFYSYKDVIGEEYQRLFLMNPLANLIVNYRRAIIDGAAPDWQSLAAISSASAIAIVLIWRVYRRFDTTYARLVIQ